MSIHKSQGQTLDRVKVDLAKVFEKGKLSAHSVTYSITNVVSSPFTGQAYVALSRATSLEGLQVLNFSADKVCSPLFLPYWRLSILQVFVHDKVRHWSTTLETLQCPETD